MRQLANDMSKTLTVLPSPPQTNTRPPIRGDNVGQLTFVVDGMCCASEVRQIESALGRVPRIARLQFDVMNHRLTVTGSPAPKAVRDAIRALGMTARLETSAAPALTFWQRRGRLVMAIVSGAFLFIGLGIDWSGGPETLAVTMLALAAISGAWFIAPRALRAARSGALDMNVLMTLATLGAAGIGEWSEGASVMFLFAVAQLLETYSMDRARNAIKALMEVAPSEGRVRRNGAEVNVPVAEITVGDTLVVRPGEKIPLDGKVTSGDSAVNQAAITGESMPVDKRPGDDVFAGSLNEHGSLEVVVTKLVEDTTLAKIIHAVEAAQASRAPSQGTIERFASVYTPAVVLLAVVLMILPPLIGLGTWGEWFYRALAMLVIACPCALVISTPVAIVSGLAGAARAGVLVKGGLYLERAGAATVIAFDKTGTLTVGRPAVTAVVTFTDDRTGVLRTAAAMERNSEHPIARAVVDTASSEGLTFPAVGDFKALVGRGVRATVEGRTFFLGNRRLCEELGVWTPRDEAFADKIERAGQTAIMLADDQAVLGIITVADRIRAEAGATVQALRRLGIRKTVMLTGDNDGAASSIASQLMLDDYKANLLPDEKVSLVQQLEKGGERVIFIGDGINDAPALAAASVGIAMGAAGTDVALETADVALMADDLLKLPLAIRISRKTTRIIKQNITFSLVNKAVFIVLAVGGWATLWMAVASDMGASIAVILNGLRARQTPAEPDRTPVRAKTHP